MPFTLKKEVNLATVIQIAGLIVAAILFFDRMDRGQKEQRNADVEIMRELQQTRARIEGVEKYLSSKDPHYWEVIRNMSFEEERNGRADRGGSLQDQSARTAAVPQF